MGKIATQDELNKLLDSSVDLGRGGVIAQPIVK